MPGVPGDDPTDPTAELAAAVQHATKAMIAAAREVLDAVEKVVDDPGTTEGVLRTVGGWAAGLATLVDEVRRVSGARPGPSSPRRDDGGGLEHIEVG